MTAPTFGARDLDVPTLLGQIGKPNVFAISGGRVVSDVKGSGIILPVRYGYTVEVYLADDDTYTVRRVFTRAGRRKVHGEVHGIYAEDVGEMAYRASCYHDPLGT